MKLLFVVICLCVSYITVVHAEGSNATIAKTTNSKDVEKSAYPKKVNSNKKAHVKNAVKKNSNITDKFRDLPADDLAFIKELDKQFKLHGEKVKIKVENKNVSVAKTNKRTIDGELGYGYHYDSPKFMFYPYSQQDIGSIDSNYYSASDAKADVSIEPSYSYELKPQSYITQNEPQVDLPKAQHQQHAEHYEQKQQQYEEPVIVLRIPGPAKYATHLQMLLQKYLEIRAAQYLHILEEAEQGHLHKQEQQQQQQLEHFDYGYGNNAIAERPAEHVEQHQQQAAIPEQHAYTQQLQYEHQGAVDPHAVHYPEIDNVYHSYKHRHFSHHKQTQIPLQDTQSYYAAQQNIEEQHLPQNQHQQQDQHQYQQQQFHYQPQVQEQPQFYYTHQQQYAQPEGPPANTYQQVYLVAMPQPVQVQDDAAQGQHEKQHPIYVQDEPQNSRHPVSLHIGENNPRPTHTQVVFTHKQDHSPHDYQMYQLPSIKPNERRASASTPENHQDFQHQQADSPNYQQNYHATDAGSAEATKQMPYNYHAHGVKARARGRAGHTRRAIIAKQADKGLQKVHKYVREKLDAEAAGAAEFKASQAIDE